MNVNWKAGAVMIFLGLLVGAQLIKGGGIDRIFGNSPAPAPSAGQPPAAGAAAPPSTPAPSASQGALAPAAAGAAQIAAAVGAQ